MTTRKLLTLTRLVTLSGALAGGIATSLSAAELTDLNKDLEIMSTILQTAVQQNGTGDQRAAFRVRGVSYTYLADQGAVFTVETSQSGYHIREFFDEFDFDVFLDERAPKPPRPPMPTHVIDGADYENIVIDVDPDQLQDIAEGAIEQAHKALSNLRGKMRELREEERDLTFEEREIERRKRDIEFELRRAEGERQQELQAELDEIQAELAKLYDEKNKVVKIRVEMEQEKQQKAQQKQAQEAEKRQQFLSSFEAAVTDSFCRYGSGMKSLDKNQKVNVILTGIGQPQSDKKRRHDRQDRIYVFEYKHIRDCVADKIDANKLLEKAEVYSF